MEDAIGNGNGSLTDTDSMPELIFPAVFLSFDPLASEELVCDCAFCNSTFNIQKMPLFPTSIAASSSVPLFIANGAFFCAVNWAKALHGQLHCLMPKPSLSSSEDSEDFEDILALEFDGAAVTVFTCWS